MAGVAGAFGCATQFAAGIAGLRDDEISNNQNVAHLIKYLQNYYFVKGFFRNDPNTPHLNAINAYPDEKRNNAEILALFSAIPDVDLTPAQQQEIQEFQNFLFSMFAIDILPFTPYGIHPAIIQCINDNRLPTVPNPPPQGRFSPPAGSVYAIMMRKLGVPFVKWDWNWSNPPNQDQDPQYRLSQRYSIVSYQNFLKKLAFFNTVRIHDDLHAGNFVFDIETKEMNIIDMGLTVPIQADHVKRSNAHGISIDQIRRDVEVVEVVNGQQIRFQNERRFNRVLERQRQLVLQWEKRAPVGTPYYWQTRLVDMAVAPPDAGRTIFDTPDGITNFWNAMWGNGLPPAPLGELYSLFHSDIRQDRFNLIVNTTADIFNASKFILYKSNFWRCPRVIKFFSVLFSHPNPLLRPLPYNVLVILRKILKAPQDKVDFIHTGQEVFSIESPVGDSKNFNLDNTNYTILYNAEHRLSLWKTDPYLSYYRIMNYYYICLMLRTHFNDIVNTDVFRGIQGMAIRDSMLARNMYAPFRGIPQVNYQATEREGLINLRNEIGAVEPLIVKNDAEINDALFDYGPNLPNRPADPQFANLP